jgi:2-(1,2-epoxy-1,2-dihydrophenyl)acetyl-CoA isomerase
MIDFSLQDGIARLTFNRPTHFNALDTAGIRELAAIAAQLTHETSLRVVVLRGSGEQAFCAGGDVTAFHAEAARVGELLQDMTDPLNIAVARFMHLPVPVVAAVNGVAAGVGLSLVAMADLAIAVDSARFNTAYTAIGFTPDGGSSWLLPRLVGVRRAMELYLTGRTLKAAEALEWGLVNQVVAREAFDAALESLLTRLASGPRGSFAATKRLVLEAGHRQLEAQLSLEARTIIAQGRSAEGLEGVRAFIEKRAPRFAQES